MSLHCLHERLAAPQPLERFCCWCDLEQRRVFDFSRPLHGSRLGAPTYESHWEPSSSGECPRTATHEAEA